MSAALIERLESATGGGRELSRFVLEATGHVWHLDFGSAWWSVGPDREPLPSKRIYDTREASVTESLDAALALAERVLPDMQWCIARDDGFATILRYRAWVATHQQVVESPLRSVGGPTPALALCIAILKAVAAQSPTEQVGETAPSKGEKS